MQGRETLVPVGEVVNQQAIPDRQPTTAENKSTDREKMFFESLLCKGRSALERSRAARRSPDKANRSHSIGNIRTEDLVDLTNEENKSPDGGIAKKRKLGDLFYEDFPQEVEPCKYLVQLAEKIGTLATFCENNKNVHVEIKKKMKELKGLIVLASGEEKRKLNLYEKMKTSIEYYEDVTQRQENLRRAVHANAAVQATVNEDEILSIEISNARM